MNLVILDEFYHDNKKNRLSPETGGGRFIDCPQSKRRYRVYEAYCKWRKDEL